MNRTAVLVLLIAFVAPVAAAAQLSIDQEFFDDYARQETQALQQHRDHLEEVRDSGNRAAAVYLAQLYYNEGFAQAPEQALTQIENAIAHGDADGHYFRCRYEQAMTPDAPKRAFLDCVKNAYRAHGSRKAEQAYIWAIQDIRNAPTDDEKFEAKQRINELAPDDRRLAMYAAKLMDDGHWIEPWPGADQFVAYANDWNLPNHWTFTLLMERQAGVDPGQYAYFNSIRALFEGFYGTGAAWRLGEAFPCQTMSDEVYVPRSVGTVLRDAPGNDGAELATLKRGERLCAYGEPRDGWIGVTSMEQPTGGWARLRALNGPAPRVLGLPLHFASKTDLVRAAKDAGGTVIAGDQDDYFQVLDAHKLIPGAATLVIGQAKQTRSGLADYVALLEYRFPSRNAPQQASVIRDYVAARQGRPDTVEGQLNKGPLSFTWHQGGVTTSVRRGWPDTSTTLRYRVDHRYPQLQAEVENVDAAQLPAAARDIF